MDAQGFMVFVPLECLAIPIQLAYVGQDVLYVPTDASALGDTPPATFIGPAPATGA